MKSLANHQHQQQLQGKALAATVAVYWRGRGHVACTSFYSNDSDGSHRCSAATVDPTHPPDGANVRPVAKIIGKNKNLPCTVGKWSFNSWFLGHIASLSPPNGAPISPDAFARLWTNPNASFTPFDATRQLQCRAVLGGVNWSLEDARQSLTTAEIWGPDTGRAIVQFTSATRQNSGELGGTAHLVTYGTQGQCEPRACGPQLTASLWCW